MPTTNLFTPTFIEAIRKGIISLLWRVAAIVVVGLLALLSNSIGLLNLSPNLVLIIGGILGEITKQVNTWAQTKLGVAKKLGLSA